MPLTSPSTSVSLHSIGIGGTTKWKLGILDESTTLAFYFKLLPETKNEKSVVQIICKYLNSLGQSIIRVVSAVISRTEDASNSMNPDVICNLLMREAFEKVKVKEDAESVKLWLDQCINQLQMNCNGSELSPKFNKVKQFIEDLKHSPLLNHVNYSPDEICYMRFWAKRQTLLFYHWIMDQINPFWEVETVERLADVSQ